MNNHDKMVKQVIVIRKDLNMRKGKMCAQAAHSSMKSILGDRDSYWIETSDNISIPLDSYLKEWLFGNYTKIVVGCDSEEELKYLHLQAIQSMIRTALITDIGLTEFHDVPTYTALAIGPHKADEIDRITGHLKLL